MPNFDLVIREIVPRLEWGQDFLCAIFTLKLCILMHFSAGMM